MVRPDIVKLLKDGSMEAFDSVYHACHAQLYHFALRITGGNQHRAEELTQWVFIRLWEVRHRVDEEKNLLAFLCTIAKNHFLNEHQHALIRYIHEEWVKDNFKTYEQSTEHEVERSELDRLIDELTEKLPPKRREIFVMSRREGKSGREISQLLDISESTVETQLGKALKYIREELVKYYSCPV